MTAWKWRPRRPAAAASPAPDDDVTYDDAEYDDQDDQDDEEEAWYDTRPPVNPDADGPQTWTVSPGVQVTITQAPQQAAATQASNRRRSLIRQWLLRHGAAAGVGWMFGLYQSISAFLDSLGHGGAAAGLALAGFGWWFAEIITDNLGGFRLFPRRLLPALRWAARIPFATALLVTALHAPNAVL